MSTCKLAIFQFRLEVRQESMPWRLQKMCSHFLKSLRRPAISGWPFVLTNFNRSNNSGVLLSKTFYAIKCNGSAKSDTFSRVHNHRSWTKCCAVDARFTKQDPGDSWKRYLLTLGGNL